MEFSREKESLLTMVEKQRLVIEYFLLRIEKLEETTRISSNANEIPSIKGDKIVNENTSMGDGKIIEENPSKKGIEKKTEVNRVRVRYGDKVCYHCYKRG